MKKYSKLSVVMVLFCMLSLFITSAVSAQEVEIDPSKDVFKNSFKMAVMVSKDPVKEAAKYNILNEYLKESMEDIDNIELVIADSYQHAVELFKVGDIDGMFAGSFVASIFIKKGIAVPLVRPFNEDGVSTYRAIVIGSVGSKAFIWASALYDKKVAYCAYASSGEIFARALLKGEEPSDRYTPVISKSHGSAIKALMDGEVDYAIVKDLVYGDGSGYPNTIIVRKDISGNPNNTLILSNNAFTKYGAAIESSLLSLELGSTDIAQEVKSVFKIIGFIKTNEDDFLHTYQNLKKAKIDADKFNFEWHK